MIAAFFIAGADCCGSGLQLAHWCTGASRSLPGRSCRPRINPGSAAHASRARRSSRSRSVRTDSRSRAGNRIARPKGSLSRLTSKPAILVRTMSAHTRAWPSKSCRWANSGSSPGNVGETSGARAWYRRCLTRASFGWETAAAQAISAGLTIRSKSAAFTGSSRRLARFKRFWREMSCCETQRTASVARSRLSWITQPRRLLAGDAPPPLSRHEGSAGLAWECPRLAPVVRSAQISARSQPMPVHPSTSVSAHIQRTCGCWRSHATTAGMM